MSKKASTSWLASKWIDIFKNLIFFRQLTNITCNTYSSTQFCMGKFDVNCNIGSILYNLSATRTRTTKQNLDSRSTWVNSSLCMMSSPYPRVTWLFQEDPCAVNLERWTLSSEPWAVNLERWTLSDEPWAVIRELLWPCKMTTRKLRFHFSIFGQNDQFRTDLLISTNFEVYWKLFTQTRVRTEVIFSLEN
jgi:hypothetical protein